MVNGNNFDFIAARYDALSRIVFGQKIKNAQINSLQYIPAGATILIAGGGTGWILEEIAEIFPEGLHITYVDKSLKMVTLSQERSIGLNKVEFINASIEDIKLPLQKFDVILTPFFLDCFPEKTLSPVFEKLNNGLKNEGRWINIDFYLSSKSPFWQKAMVQIMYLFFRLFSRIETNRLPNVNKYFGAYTIIAQEMFLKNFIRMQVFLKN